MLNELEEKFLKTCEEFRQWWPEVVPDSYVKRYARWAYQRVKYHDTFMELMRYLVETVDHFPRVADLARAIESNKFRKKPIDHIAAGNRSLPPSCEECSQGYLTLVQKDSGQEQYVFCSCACGQYFASRGGGLATRSDKEKEGFVTKKIYRTMYKK